MPPNKKTDQSPHWWTCSILLFKRKRVFRLTVLVTWFGYGHSTLRAHVKDTNQNDEAAQTTFIAGVIEKTGNIGSGEEKAGCLKGSLSEEAWEASRNEAINPDDKLGRYILAKHKDELWNSYVCPKMAFPLSVSREWYCWEFSRETGKPLTSPSAESSPSILNFTLWHSSRFLP